MEYVSGYQMFRIDRKQVKWDYLVREQLLLKWYIFFATMILHDLKINRPGMKLNDPSRFIC